MRQARRAQIRRNLHRPMVSAGVPSSVLSTTIEAVTLVAAGTAATEAVSVKVAALTEGVLKTMLVKKLKTASLLMITMAAALTGAANTIYLSYAAEMPTAQTAAVKQPTPGEDGPKAGPKHADPVSDKEKLQGTWEAVSVEFGGKDSVEKKDVKRMGSYEFKGDKVKWMANAYSAYTIAPSKRTKEIDLEAPAPEPGVRFAKDMRNCKGIYELKGDELLLCIAPPNRERPTEFKCKQGEETLLLRLKRAKPQESKGGKDARSPSKHGELLTGAFEIANGVEDSYPHKWKAAPELARRQLAHLHCALTWRQDTGGRGATNSRETR
jgi:uncharacterized protein (TIGR03067 family)